MIAAPSSTNCGNLIRWPTILSGNQRLSKGRMAPRASGGADWCHTVASAQPGGHSSAGALELHVIPATFEQRHHRSGKPIAGELASEPFAPRFHLHLTVEPIRPRNERKLTRPADTCIPCTPSVSPDLSVRPNGAVHQWRKDPPRELSVDPGS